MVENQLSIEEKSIWRLIKVRSIIEILEKNKRKI